MKKGFLTTLALFASLALVACGGGTNNTSKKADSKHTHVAAENAEWKSDDSKHWKECKDNDGGKVGSENHKWVDDTTKTGTPATCSQEGVKYEVCSVCGKTRETKLSKTEHTWNEGVASGSCGEAGKITYTCTVCNETKEETSGYIPHAWVKTGDVAAGDGGLAYELVKCSKCNKDGLRVYVKNSDGTNNMTITGTPKTSPAGTVKLGATDDSATAVIKLDAAKTGKLYFSGSMDYWYTSNNQNEQKGIYNGKGTASKEDGIANFKMEVGPDAEHLTEVTLTADKDLLYKDFLPEEPGFTGVADTDWSQIGDIEVGNVSLTAGLNTIRFTRLDSYNLAISAFVVAFDA